ncbi:MAG TPA: hypothetical protein VMH48_01795 [Methylomirabilota bacterium]|nr:hypothetical protein [Methylomirabilota bacterium]
MRVIIGYLVLVAGLSVAGQSPAADNPTFQNKQGGPPAQTVDKSAQNDRHVLPRGKKLILKDGTYQLVRNYERNGDRVRYYSAERGDWEEIPASMVDWDATSKAEAAEANEQDALAQKAHKQEQEQQIMTVMDVDASLQVAPGVFLPPGEGMFVINGKSVTQLEQAGTQIKTDKKQFLKQVLSPIPIVPGKQNIEIPGSRAKVRITNAQVEFYLREAAPDPDRTSSIIKSSRPGESGPEVELVKATVKGNKRQLESIRSLFGEQLDEKRATISLERWEVAPTVYRFTLSQPLPPGEYALAEILPGGMNLFVWDFGLDPGAKAAAPASKNQ